jgi:hypothetical protein
MRSLDDCSGIARSLPAAARDTHPQASANDAIALPADSKVRNGLRAAIVVARRAMVMPYPKHFEACFLCHQPFEFGSHDYQGRRIPEWDMMTCTSCYESNRDGIVPEVFPHVIPYLKSRGVEIKLNARGWIDWPS